MSGEAFVQRMLASTGAQLAHQLAVPTAGERQVVALQLGCQPLLVDRLPDVVEPRRVQHGEGLAPPQPEGLFEQGGRGLVVGRARLGDQAGKPVQVHRHRVDREDVAARPSRDLDIGGTCQGAPQPGQVAVQRPARPLREPTTPHAVEELTDWHDPVGVDRQQRQHAALPRMPEVDQGAVDTGLDVAEQAELHRHLDHRLDRTPPKSGPCPQGGLRRSAVPSDHLLGRLGTSQRVAFPTELIPVVIRGMPERVRWPVW
jgi:hypothetical protein